MKANGRQENLSGEGLEPLQTGPWKAIPWDDQLELRDGDYTIGFLGKREDGAIPPARTRAYASLICAAPLLLRACILALDREDIADDELGDILREVACVALGRRKYTSQLAEKLGLINQLDCSLLSITP